MAGPVLRVRELGVALAAGGRERRPVDGVSFDLGGGETFALLGESGCGKSMTALALMGLLPRSARAGGSVRLGGEELLGLSEAALSAVRGARMAMIFQEPMSALNPVFTVGEQIGEALRRHRGLRGRALQEHMVALLDAVRIPDPRRRARDYPHQLSGGMKQRVMIAMALAGEPEVLIADEPTTALDVTVQAQILALLRELQSDTGMALLLISHDLGVVAGMADRVAVMYAGQLVEQADRAAFFAAPAHPYSQALFAALPEGARRDRPLPAIKGQVPPLDARFRGCRFAERCPRAAVSCRAAPPPWQGGAGGRRVRCLFPGPAGGAPAVPAASPPPLAAAAAAPLLEVEDLAVYFPLRRGLLRRAPGQVRAVDGVSLQVARGRTLALVGESGCGKSTVGKAVLQLIPATRGRVRYDGVAVAGLDDGAMRSCRRRLQIVFQDAYSAMNPRLRVEDIIAEGMTALKVVTRRAGRERRVGELLEQVGLGAAAKGRYPHEFSGGQRQRICIARALAVQPGFIVCDEPTSALDVSVQAQILNLLKSLQEALGLGYLFITHNMSVVHYLAHEVAVMYLGRIVESGPVDAVLNAPRHPYTQALLAAVPTVHGKGRADVTPLAGDLPSPVQPPEGCYFHPRCPRAREQCRRQYPPAVTVAGGHVVCCVLADGVTSSG
ncbi:MAG TPA: ABC transporter ATP-binding protein [Gammaproteobacteria bacterium]|nr:ABC transporter ATP-binding protein [Gammaproteobacteria bacterium]